MLEWLKEILGDSYTEDIDGRVSAEIGKGFVARADFNTKNDEVKTLQGQLKTAQDGLKAFDGVDVEGLKGQIKKLQDDMAAQADAFKFDTLLDGAIRDAKGKNVKAVRALLDMDALRESKDQTADIKAALDALAESDGYLFDAAPADEGGTGITASTGGEHGDGGKPEPRNLAEALRMQMEGDGV
jgi:hypothetical protein